MIPWFIRCWLFRVQLVPRGLGPHWESEGLGHGNFLGYQEKINTYNLIIDHQDLLFIKRDYYDLVKKLLATIHIWVDEPGYWSLNASSSSALSLFSIDLSIFSILLSCTLICSYFTSNEKTFHINVYQHIYFPFTPKTHNILSLSLYSLHLFSSHIYYLNKPYLLLPNWEVKCLTN